MGKLHTYDGSQWVEIAKNGVDGSEVEMRVDSGYIQWKYDSDVSWTNLIEVSTLKGDIGDAATITVGTVTTVDPTDPATVTNVGTSGAAILDFEIPQGETGSVTAHDHDSRYFTETEVTNALALKENISKVTPITVSTATAAGTAAKVATTTGGTYTPTEGDIINVTFTAANTATNPTINIDGSGAKSILLGNVNPTAVAMAGTKVMMWYDGTAFQLFGSQRVSDTDTNTTYSEISEAEITAGSASTTRSISGRRAGFILTSAKGVIYPVGALYHSNNSTSPATSLGFGTWTQTYANTGTVAGGNGGFSPNPSVSVEPRYEWKRTA